MNIHEGKVNLSQFQETKSVAAIICVHTTGIFDMLDRTKTQNF